MGVYAYVQVLVSLFPGGLVLVLLHLDFTVILRIQMYKKIRNKIDNIILNSNLLSIHFINFPYIWGYFP